MFFMNSKYRKYVTYTAAVGVLTLSVILGGLRQGIVIRGGGCHPFGGQYYTGRT